LAQIKAIRKTAQLANQTSGDAMKLKLIDNWFQEAKRLWSVRVALFWGAISGLILVWSAFSDVLPLWLYATGGIVASAAFAAARLLKQPGADE
jgi:hypothetical protein